LNRQAERLAWLAASLERLPGSGIIYCLTVRDTENVAEWLVDRGFDVDRYFGGLDGDARIESERRLQNNEIKALVATTALGMGYDKPDLGFVVHFQAPGSAVAYYQQVGRAGRALDRSVAVLLRGVEDADIQDFFITHAFAAPDVAARVLGVFDEASGPVSLNRVMAEIDIKLGPLELVVKQLDVDGALRRIKARTYERTLQPWTYPTERVDSVTAARRDEQAAMREYLETPRCRMQFLTDLLDDPARDACGICDNCTGSSAAIEVPADLLAAAEAFLRDRPLVIRAKLQGVPVGERVEEGRALAQWGDAGWGALVREGRQVTGEIDERLVDALVDMIRAWRPAPEWITAVPSLRRPRLVDGLARALATRLQLPYEPCVMKVEERPEQRYQQNRAHQEANVAGAFNVNGPVPAGPVLLVDDLVGSGWTMTEVGRVLRRAGSGPVRPVALASTAGREQ
jgi:ATP-dependent DNA helicase RecQ